MNDSLTILRKGILDLKLFVDSLIWFEDLIIQNTGMNSNFQTDLTSKKQEWMK